MYNGPLEITKSRYLWFRRKLNFYKTLFQVCLFVSNYETFLTSCYIAQSAWTVKYTDCISAEELKKKQKNECPGYDTKQSDGEAPVMLELWEMQSTSSLPLLPGSLWPRVVVPDKALIYGWNRTNLRTYAQLKYLK